MSNYLSTGQNFEPILPVEDFTYDRAEIPLPEAPDPLDADPYYWTRHRSEPGEAWRADETWPEKPLTLDNDARMEPNIFGGERLRYPIRDFSVQFPHHWIDYEQMQVAVYPDTPPMPPGYAPAPYIQNEMRRAIDEALPHFAVPEEAMARDISGFSDLSQLVSLDATSLLSSGSGQATTQAVQTEAEKAAAAGASPSTVDQIVNFGAQIGALYLQKRQLDQMQKEAEAARASQLELERIRLQQQQLAVEAARAGAPSGVVNDMKPQGGVSPLVVAGAATGAVLLATQVL